ncbi:MAG: S-layer homology domain-containing protein, partial [Oscillospiraceae bacterium]
DVITVPKSKVAFVTNETGEKSLAFTVSDDLTIGEYAIVFEFTDPEFVAAFGKKIIVPQKINVEDNAKLVSKSYGIIGVERFNEDEYKIVEFKDEASLKKYRTDNKLNEKSCQYREMLLEIRGDVKKYKDELGKEYYQAMPEFQDVTLNNVVQYSGSEPLVIKQTSNGNVEVKGKKGLSVINNMKFWDSNFSIHFDQGTISTLNKEKYPFAPDDDDPATPPDVEFVDNSFREVKIDYTGMGQVVQSVAGFTIDIRYGVFTENWAEDKFEGNGIDFGGKVALNFLKKPDTSKAPAGEEEDEERFKLSADISSVLYGEGKDKIEFKGIDMTTEFGLPKESLGGILNPKFDATLEINTQSEEYGVEVGIDVFTLELEGKLKIKVVDYNSSTFPVLDEVNFAVGGMKVPVVAPVLYLTKVGGGYKGLAATISGEFEGLPPMTLELQAEAELINVLEGELAASIGLNGLSLAGKVSLKKYDGVKMKAALDAQWVEPFFINGKFDVDIFDCILGGVSFVIADNYFYGYGYLRLQIPRSIPIVGGTKLAGVEGAVSTQFIGANVKILFIKMGVVYYWSDGEVNFGDTVDLSAPPRAGNALYSYKGKEKVETEFGTKTRDYTAMYGTNFRRLSSSKVSNSKTSNGKMSSPLLGAGGNTITKSLPDGAVDSLMFEIPLSGAKVPTSEDITLTTPKGEKIALAPDTTLVDQENGTAGNFLVQQREVNGVNKKFAYISVTNNEILKDIGGNWTVKSSDSNIAIDDFNVNSVANIPELGTVTTNKIDTTKNEAEVSWTVIDDGVATKNSKVNFYLTTDKDVATKLKTDPDKTDIGFPIGECTASDKAATLKIPDTIPSGNYYLFATMQNPDSGVSFGTSTTAMAYENKNLPVAIESAELVNAGDGKVMVNVSDRENFDYTHLMVSLIDKDGVEVPNGFGYFKTDEKIILVCKSNQCNLKVGESYTANIKTVKEATLDNETIPVWATDYIKTAYKMGYIKGSAVDDTIVSGANDNITREELATILYRTKAVENIDGENDFIDKSDISDFAVEAVNAFANLGILNGYEDKTFKPQNAVTRDETAKILSKWLEKVVY